MINDAQSAKPRPGQRLAARNPRTLRSHALAFGLAALFAVSLPGATSAQLTKQFQGLFDYGACNEPLCLNTDASPGHGDHFIASRVQGANNILGFIQSSLSASFASLPVASATSGVTFEFSDAGLPVETQVSPGPVFAERAQTLGAGRIVLGANVTGIDYQQLRGVNTDALSLVFTHSGGNDVVGDITFENDLIGVDLDLSMRVLAFTASATMGLTDKIDLGVAVPFITTELNGSTFAGVDVFDPTETPRHNFGDDDPSLTASSTASGTASGIGDIAVRLKANLLRTQSYGVAFLGEARLPTGAVEDFLGSGETTIRGMGIWSARSGRFSPHANVGFQFTTGELLTPSALAVVGFDHLVSEAVTISADFLGRFEVGDSKLTLPAPVDVVGRGEVSLSNIPVINDNSMDVALGIKATPMSGLRAIANVLVPVNDGGMRPSMMWTFGLEYSLH